MSRYRLGADAERRAVALLREERWPLVVRSAGSNSPFDVIALDREGGLAIQVKRSAKGKRSFAKALDSLQAAAEFLPPALTCSTQAIERMLVACRQNGIAGGPHVGSAQAIRKWTNRGATFMSYGMDASRLSMRSAVCSVNTWHEELDRWVSPPVPARK